MVSLRSGSTTDQKDADGQPEISSKRKASRQRGKANSVRAALPAPTSSSDHFIRLEDPITRQGATLAVIAEASPGVMHMTEEEEFIALQHEAEAAAEQAVHSSQKATDTPARNTRARNRLLALPVPIAAGEGGDQQQESGQPHAQGDSSAGEPASPQSSGSGSHPGLLVRAPGSQPTHNGADSCDDSEQTSHLQSSPSADSAAADMEHHQVNAGSECTPGPHPESEGSDHEEPAASSSGWSSDDEGADQAGALGQMAQSMLAALAASRRSSSAASAPASAPRNQSQSMRYLGGSRPAVANASRSAAGQALTGEVHDSSSKVAEVHWGPAVQLPSRQPADDSRHKDVLSKAEPVPARQVCRGTCAAQLVAPPRDARRMAREARKAAPDTAGSKWYDLPASQITDEVKRDLRLLRLRGVMDPKRFYKSADHTKFPKYFQFGTVVEGPTEFYSGRMTRKERKQTLTEELLADAELTQSRRKRFGALQQEKQRWGRKKGRATSKERQKVYKRPRH